MRNWNHHLVVWEGRRAELVVNQLRKQLGQHEYGLVASGPETESIMFSFDQLRSPEYEGALLRDGWKPEQAGLLDFVHIRELPASGEMLSPHPILEELDRQWSVRRTEIVLALEDGHSDYAGRFSSLEESLSGSNVFLVTRFDSEGRRYADDSTPIRITTSWLRTLIFGGGEGGELRSKLLSSDGYQRLGLIGDQLIELPSTDKLVSGMALSTAADLLRELERGHDSLPELESELKAAAEALREAFNVARRSSSVGTGTKLSQAKEAFVERVERAVVGALNRPAGKQVSLRGAKQQLRRVVRFLSTMLESAEEAIEEEESRAAEPLPEVESPPLAPVVDAPQGMRGLLKRVGSFLAGMVRSNRGQQETAKFELPREEVEEDEPERDRRWPIEMLSDLEGRWQRWLNDGADWAPPTEGARPPIEKGPIPSGLRIEVRTAREPISHRDRLEEHFYEFTRAIGRNLAQGRAARHGLVELIEKRIAPKYRQQPPYPLLLELFPNSGLPGDIADSLSKAALSCEMRFKQYGNTSYCLVVGQKASEELQVLGELLSMLLNEPVTMYFDSFAKQDLHLILTCHGTRAQHLLPFRSYERALA